MEHPAITYAECPRSMACSEQDEWEAAVELERAVRRAVDQSVIVYRDPDSWYVFVDGWRVRSVEEALERIGGEAC